MVPPYDKEDASLAAKAPTPRPIAMEVLVLGLCRTGTMSMKLALQHLGYGEIYHMSSIFDDESQARLWIEALETKFASPPSKANSASTSAEEAEQYTAKYWDRILGPYSGTSDIPTVLFVPELLAAYPDAKVILTTRSPSSWRTSMLRTIYALQTSTLDRCCLRFSSAHLKEVGRVMDLIFEHYLYRCEEEVIEKHDDMVRRECERRGREVLEFELGDGWGELCEFLEKDVPEVGWPHVNERESFRRAFRLDGRSRLVMGVGVLALAGMLGWAGMTGLAVMR